MLLDITLSSQYVVSSFQSLKKRKIKFSLSLDVKNEEGAKKDGHVLSMISIRVSFFGNSIKCAEHHYSKFTI